jgi:hypothetical protein
MKDKNGLFTIEWIGQIWHWLALTGIKTQPAHKINNLPALLSGIVWHWQALASS